MIVALGRGQPPLPGGPDRVSWTLDLCLSPLADPCFRSLDTHAYHPQLF